MLDRIKKVYNIMANENIDGLLIDSDINRRYLSGFTGTAGRILFTEKNNYFITDFRYTEQAKKQTTGYQIIEVNKNFEEGLNELLKESEVNVLGFESKAISYEQFEKYEKKLEVELKPTKKLIEDLRLIKDKSEVKKIKKAIAYTDRAFKHICNYIKPGLSEREVALELEFFLKQMGAEKNAFEFIVASGTRSSLPHGVATEKKIEKGDFVTMDFGAFFQGYCSDLTRTIIMGKPTDRQREIYNIVLEAQLAVIEKIKAGMSCKEADGIARDIIDNAGYKENFGHSLGHGIGMEVHEAPRVSYSSDSKLKTGMVVTDEPGIYIPDWGGVRIEDDLYLTDEGCQVLNSAPKELIVI